MPAGPAWYFLTLAASDPVEAATRTSASRSHASEGELDHVLATVARAGLAPHQAETRIVPLRDALFR